MPKFKTPILFIGIMFAAILIAACGESESSKAADIREENLEVVSRFIEEFKNNANHGIVDELMTSNFVHHLYEFSRSGNEDDNNLAARCYWECWDTAVIVPRNDWIEMLVAGTFYVHTILSEKPKKQMENWFLELYPEPSNDLTAERMIHGHANPA